MPRLQRKTFARPDRSRTLGAGHLEIVDLDGTTVGRVHLSPGWRWSVDVMPVVGTTSCQVRHVSYVLRAGLHIGEIEIVVGNARGVAVHAAARIAALAAPGEVLPSRTTRDLVEGSDIVCEDRGAHQLKGLPGERRLHALVRR